jgi:FkbM family methyltransferase
VLHLVEVFRHPLRTARKAAGRLRRKMTKVPQSGDIRLINNTVRFEHKNFPFLNEDDIRAMLTQSYDITLCDYLRKHLTMGDIVLDVGANVGYISAFAASCVGHTGEVHGFEPLPECFARLQLLSAMNPDFHFYFSHTALGESAGLLPISYDPNGDSRNATLVPGKESGKRALQVPVKRLDDYILENIGSPQRIKIIKIDVEGYEFQVLRGLERFLVDTRYRPRIICEIKPWELKNLGFTLEDFDEYMKKFGYRAYDLANDNRCVALPELKDMSVLLFQV